MAIGAEVDRIRRITHAWEPLEKYAYIKRVVGMTLEARGPSARVGQLCRLLGDDPEADVVMAEVVGFTDNTMILLPLSELHGVRAGMRVQITPGTFRVPVGDALRGRILDGLGRPIDGAPGPELRERKSIYSAPPHPLSRMRVTEPLELGIRSIDGLLTCGRGQRVGIFAGSGVGKSTLMGMIARSSGADVNVIGLIGERGREVRDFVEDQLGPEGLAKSVVVVATSDQPPLLRIKAAQVATTLAEHFRDQGNDVLLMMDSVTRFAMAQREVGLAAGEPPTTRGYPPSVFSSLSQLLERAGNSDRGTMTAFYSVLVEGDDMDEPITDAVRSILDGHIQMSRALADENHYPAIDVLRSVSRLMVDVIDGEHEAEAARLKGILAAYEDARDLISIGAYQGGADPKVDLAIRILDQIKGFLQQPASERSTLDETRRRLFNLLPEGGAI